MAMVAPSRGAVAAHRGRKKYQQVSVHLKISEDLRNVAKYKILIRKKKPPKQIVGSDHLWACACETYVRTCLGQCAATTVFHFVVLFFSHLNFHISS